MSPGWIRLGLGMVVRVGRHQAVVEIARPVYWVAMAQSRRLPSQVPGTTGPQIRRHDAEFSLRRDVEHLDEDPVELKGRARYVDDQLKLPVPAGAVARHE